MHDSSRKRKPNVFNTHIVLEIVMTDLIILKNVTIPMIVVRYCKYTVNWTIFLQILNICTYLRVTS